MKHNPGRKERRRTQHQSRVSDGKRKMKFNEFEQKRESRALMKVRRAAHSER